MRMSGEFSWPDYLANNLTNFFQLGLELLPASILLVYTPWPWGRGRATAPPVVEPLVLYATVCTVALLLWPYAKGRYAMPIAPAVAVLAGMAWDSLGKARSLRLRNLATGLLASLIAFQLVLVLAVVPLFADRFGGSRRAGQMIDDAIATDPAPAFCKSADTHQPDTNQISYMRTPIRCLTEDEMMTLDPPAWLVTSDDILTRFRQSRPDIDVHIVVQTPSGPGLVAAYLKRQ
jgi:hypothetical protein